MIKLEGKSVRVIKDNVVIDILSLTEDTEKDYIFNDNQNKLVINNGKAEVVSANCKNQICVNSEAIDEVGETIACLPHGLIFEVIEN